MEIRVLDDSVKEYLQGLGIGRYSFTEHKKMFSIKEKTDKWDYM